MANKRTQTTWQLPEVKEKRSELKLYNSLTRQKEFFIPLDGNNIKWYSCGPTVYDASHMGHARSYISFDILRRVLSNYFGFNILYTMNITDIDDKIIKRARQNYLYERYTVKNAKNLDQLLSDYEHILENVHLDLKNATDPDKKQMLDNTLNNMTHSIQQLINAIKLNDTKKISEAREHFLISVRDPLSDWLDKMEGSSITENSIFASLPRYWENEFHKDMAALNILPADILTRVSEYVPQIVVFIQKIIDNGLAYEVGGSVYFDVNGFDKRKKHFYAKLVPEAYGDTKSLHEGEGDLCLTDDRLSEKRSANDFALWKCSKPGEPWWDSPWSKGRPGWHIECSAMASDIFGPKIDIHTGGVDLKFPHHDNELAQSEAHFDSAEWIKYFLHTGHLTIAGCKMSKSLKNFITIQQALENHTATQLRLAFLLHSWKDTLDYSTNTMEMAVQYERVLNEFFLNVKDLIRHIVGDTPIKQFDGWTTVENNLQMKYDNSKVYVHNALCDNVDTRTVLDILRDLVCATNIYIRDNAVQLNGLLLRRIAAYITDILHIFGAIVGPRGGIGFPIRNNVTAAVEGGDVEQTVMPYLSTLAEFRDAIREKARILKAFDILKLCDSLRDEVLPNLGVRLEDRECAPSAVKLVDKEILIKERDAKKIIEAEKIAAKEGKKNEAQRLHAAKDAQKRINPKEMFLIETDKYSAFDDKGLPTHDTGGKELSKGLIKKLQKLHIAQEKKYKEYIEANGNNVS